MNDIKTYRIAVAGVALGLFMFLLGASVILATGHTVPAEYWTAGSAISGALLGLLAPSPSTPKRNRASTASSAAAQAELHAEAAQRAQERVGGPAGAAFASAAVAHETAAKASEAAAGARTGLTGMLPLVALLSAFGVSLWAGIEFDQTELQALASAAGGALLGLIGPSPAKLA